MNGIFIAADIFDFARDRNLIQSLDFDPQQSWFEIGVFPQSYEDAAGGHPGIRGTTHYNCDPDTVSLSIDDVGVGKKCINYKTAVVPSSGRPITAVAHEYFHMLGRRHAGTACPASDPAGWPPDQKGYLQGVGLDRREGSSTLGPYRVFAAQTDFPDLQASASPDAKPELYDLMSYCGKEANSWISPRYWDETLETMATGPAGMVPIASHSPETAASSPSLSVQAFSSADHAVITRVEPDPRAPSAGATSSEYALVARDADGSVVSTTPMLAGGELTHGTDDLPSLQALIPAEGVAKIEIVHAGKVIASRTRPATPPSVTITSPKVGDTVGGDATTTITFDAKVAPADAADVGGVPDSFRAVARVDLSLDDGATWTPIALRHGTEPVTVRSDVFGAAQKARVRVRLNDGFNETAAVSDPFVSLGHGPTVRIDSPSPGSQLTADASLYLSGQGLDDKDDVIPDDHLVWSIGDKRIATGARASVGSLAPGVQMLMLTATDERGRSSDAVVCVDVVAGAVGNQVSPCPSAGVDAGGQEAAAPSPVASPPASGAPMWWGLLGVVAIAVAAVATFAVARRRRAGRRISPPTGG